MHTGAMLDMDGRNYRVGSGNNSMYSFAIVNIIQNTLQYKNRTSSWF